MADKAQTGGHATPFGQRGQFLHQPQPPLIVTDQHHTGIAGAHQSQRLDQHVLAFPAADPARQHHNGMSHLQPPRIVELHHPLRADQSRIENRWIDAAMDHPDTLRIGAIAALHQLGDEMADRDDNLTLGHHRIVAALEDGALVIGTVEGGEELHPGAPCGNPGRPGRRT